MHHIFDVDIATRFGVNSAIILQNLQYWIAYNKANEKCYYEGRYWTYSSVKAFKELFPYLSEYQIRGAIQKLIDEGVIIKGNFNRDGMDRTMWYALSDEWSGKDKKEADAEQDEEPLNPFGDCDDAEIPDTVEAYAARNLYRLSPGNMQEFADYKRRLPDTLIRHAIDVACGAGARSWNYTRRVLDRYIERRFTSVAEVMADEDASAKRRQQRGPQQPDDNPLLRTKFY